jgi:uncharacterized membrane protein YbaN (DUF454 family)
MVKGVALRVLRITLGVTLLVVGVIGLFLPFLQGVLLIVAGLAVLSKESEWVRRFTELLRDKWRQRRWLKRGESLHGNG